LSYILVVNEKGKICEAPLYTGTVLKAQHDEYSITCPFSFGF
jgi:hypothetical protein